MADKPRGAKAFRRPPAKSSDTSLFVFSDVLWCLFAFGDFCDVFPNAFVIFGRWQA